MLSYLWHPYFSTQLLLLLQGNAHALRFVSYFVANESVNEVKVWTKSSLNWSSQIPLMGAFRVAMTVTATKISAVTIEHSVNNFVIDCWRCIMVYFLTCIFLIQFSSRWFPPVSPSSFLNWLANNSCHSELQQRHFWWVTIVSASCQRDFLCIMKWGIWPVAELQSKNKKKSRLSNV